MAYNIKSLLTKKGWTGEEVGKALIASLLNDIRYQGKEHELLFSQADFDKMESGLVTDRDFLAYGVYRDIYHSMVNAYNKEQGLYQQFYNGYYRYFMYLREAMKAEDFLKQAERYPLIMTEEQYNKVEREALEGKQLPKESFCGLFFALLKYFLRALESGNPEKVPADIAAAIEAAKEESAEGHALYNSYNELMGEGYYILPDGRRSDKMSEEEWHKALDEMYPPSSETQNPLAVGWELFFKGANATRESYRNLTGKDLPEADDQEILDGLEQIINSEHDSRNPLQKCLEELCDSVEPQPEWRTATEAPEGLTAYDLLHLIVEVSHCVKLETFGEEYKALYTALEAYIKERVPRAAQLKPSQLLKEFIDWGELAEHKVGDFENLLAAYTRDCIVEHLGEQGLKFADLKRITRNGIAIMHQPMSCRLTEDGEYKEAADPFGGLLFSIDNIAGDNRERKEIDGLQHHLFIPALSYLYAYNALIDIIGAVYDIDGIAVAKADTSIFENQLDGFNKLLYCFYSTVYGDKEEKAKKRGLIKEVFSPVYAETYKPTAEAVAKVKEELSQLGISSTARKKLKDFESLIAELDNREGAC